MTTSPRHVSRVTGHEPRPLAVIPRVTCEPACPECTGTGWVPAAPGASFYRACPRAQVSFTGLVHRSRLSVRPAHDWKRAEELRARLEELIRSEDCPLRGAPPNLRGGACARETLRCFLQGLANAWGEDNAVPREQLEALTGLDERAVKEMVRHLIDIHRLSDKGLVLGRYRAYRKRTECGEVVIRGYFWCLSAEEAWRSSRQFAAQVVSELRTLANWVGPLGIAPKLRPAIRELAGQYKLTFKESPPSS